MRLGLGLHQVQIQNCVLCNQSVANHAEACLFNLLEAATLRRKRIVCPCCHNAKVDINTSDLYECGSCRTQFCASEVVPGEDAANLPRLMLIDMEQDSVIHVVQMKRKGKGQMKWSKAVRDLEKQVKVAINKTKEQKATAQSAHWLAEGNAAKEKGNAIKAAKCYSKSQFWLDRANRLAGNG